MGPRVRVRAVAARKDSGRCRPGFVAQYEPSKIALGMIKPRLSIGNHLWTSPGECSIARDLCRSAWAGLELASRLSPSFVRVEGMKPGGVSVGCGSPPAAGAI